MLQSPNFQKELPIKSNKTFLFEWWNIFFYLYSEKMIETFKQKNKNVFSQEALDKLSMRELFKKPYPDNQIGFTSYNDLQLINSTIYEPVPKNQAIFQSTNTSFVPKVPKPNAFEKAEKSDKKLFSTSNITKPTPIQNYSLNNSSSNLDTSHDYMVKKRKRYLKNNKYVFVQPGSAAAKKLGLENENKEGDIKVEKKEEQFEGVMLPEYSIIEEQLGKGKKPRGSRYRGVSRNGNQWQVLIMVNKKKRYVGSYSNEEEAARAYDKVALQNHGAKAKTNFDYLEEEVQKILADPPLLKLSI